MRLNLKMLSWGAAAVTVFLVMPSCSNDEGIKLQDDGLIQERGLTVGTPVSVGLIGLSPENELVSLLSGPPVQEVGRIPITGLRGDEAIIAIDTRPKNKQLYGVSSSSILYRIDPVSGTAFPASLSGQPFSPAINGSLVGFDISPIDDVARLITDLGQALRISLTTGAVVGVDVLFNPSVVPINSIAFSTATNSARATLYDLDASTGNLYKQSAYNGGSLAYVGATGFFFSGEGGFEITNTNSAFTVQYGRSRFPASGGGFGSNPPEDITQDAYRLLNINLRTGQATSYGKVAPMIGLAVK